MLVPPRPSGHATVRPAEVALPRPFAAACPLLAAALMPLLSSCERAPTSSSAPPAEVASPPAASGVEWLDDEAMAAGVTHHRIAGQVRAPRAQEAALRKLLRDGLVARAAALGFARLDNLQLEVSCADDAPDATACTGRVVAIASR